MKYKIPKFDKPRISLSWISSKSFLINAFFWSGKIMTLGTVKFRTFCLNFIKNPSFFRHCAAAVLVSSFIISSAYSAKNNEDLRLSTIFLPDPGTITDIVTGISNYTPSIQADSMVVAQNLVDAGNSQLYIDQISVLAMSNDNPFDGFAITYTVQKGDTWSGIAKINNLHTASIFAANGIDETKLKQNGMPSLKPGDRITIPAEDIDGGPTNWVSILNDINAAKLAAQQKAANAKSLAKAKTKTKPGISISSGGIARDLVSHGSYPGGYCTSYVASRRNVGQWGNAGHWLAGARADGYSTGSSPRQGAIMVTAESGWGHVAYVENVNDDGSFTVSEENYKGFGIISTRYISGGVPIKGFIY